MNMGLVGDISAHEKAFSAAEVWTLVRLLDDQGSDTSRLLREAALDRASLYEPQTRIALAQQLRLQAHASRCAALTPIGIVAGQELHLTAFGTVGFAMLSSATLGQALEIAVRYARLLNMKFGLALAIEGGEAVLRFDEQYFLDHTAREQCLQLDMAKAVTLLRDLAGGSFTLSSISLDGAPAPETWRHPHFGCPILAGGGNALRFSATLLARPLPQAHLHTCRSALQMCDRMLAVDIERQGLPFQIKKMLLNSKGVIAPLAEVADQMCMSPRTLRRRLEESNTSYVRIVEEVRKAQAMRILSSSTMTTEAIAERLGYSDAANFRHAFKRWTGCSPRQFRQRNGIASQEPGLARAFPEHGRKVAADWQGGAERMRSLA